MLSISSEPMNSEESFIRAMFPYKVEVWFSDNSKCILRKEHFDLSMAKQKAIEYSEVTPFIIKLINYDDGSCTIYKGGVKQ